MDQVKSLNMTRKQKIIIAAIVVGNLLFMGLLAVTTFQVAEKANANKEYVTTIAPASPGLVGNTGPQGPPPTPEQVSEAVNDYCLNTGSCEGKTPTMAMVFEAVSQYCAADKCKGPEGTAGANGANGADAPPITAADIQAAVVNYCANGNCDGPTGSTGANGVNGIDGQPPASWRFTYLTTEYECKRTDPFDAANPTYTCEPITQESKES
jgi:hypothetical protein